jgi:hypothetical protein
VVLAQTVAHEVGDTNKRNPHAVRWQPERVLADAVFVGLSLFVVFVRARALSKAGAPPGFDGGDWLGLGRGLFGDHVRPGGLAASPIIPVLIFVGVKTVGAQFTFVSFGALLGALPGAGVYFVLRRQITALDAALVSVLVMACAGSGEAASWGGYPQLLALGLLPVAVVMADRAFDRAKPSLAVGAGVLLLVVVLVSDFVFTFAALAAAVIVIARLPTLVGFVGWKRIGKLLVLLAAPLVLALPLEVQILKARIEAVLHPAGTSLVNPSAIDRINFVFSDRALLWRIVMLAGAGALVLLWERRFETHWRIAAGLALVGFGLTVAFGEPRLAYVLPTAAALSVTLWSPELRRLTRVPVFAVLAGIACVVQLQAMPKTARVQAAYYQALTPSVVDAINWTRTHSDASTLIAVTPYRDGPALGWWVEGLAGRHTLTGSNLRWLHFASERATAEEAASVFASGVPTVEGLRRARALQVDFLFIDKRWSDFQTGRVASLRRESPHSVAFENSAVVVLSTAGLS